MKICVESQLLNHHQRSGLMTYTEGLVNSLAQLDHVNNYHLVYFSLRRRAEEMPGPVNTMFKKIVLPCPDRIFWGRQALLDTVIFPAYFNREEIRVFHRPSGYTMPKVKGVFNVLTVHDLRTLTIGDERWKQNIEQYKRALKLVDICVTVSECTKRDLIEHMQMDERRIRVVPLAADSRFRAQSDYTVKQVMTKHGINSPYLLAVGSVPRKNIEGIIRAFSQCRFCSEYKLVLVCKFDLEKYQVLCREFGIERQVQFLENIEERDLIALYSGCTAFLFPSLYEGFGLPILEAMQCGAPVITSNVSSCPEVAGDAALFVNPSRVEEISEAIDQICVNENLRKDLIVRGYDRAKLFSWDKFAEGMKAIYSLA